MPKISTLVLLAPGFEEIEAVTIIDVLRRADFNVLTVGLTEGLITGSHGIPIQPDHALDDLKIDPETIDLLVLPGGMPGSATLRDDPRVQSLIQTLDRAQCHIAAICAAPIALSAAGLTQRGPATSYPAFKNQIQTPNYSEKPVVRADRITTSRGVGTALAFALDLVTQFSGSAQAQELSRAMLVEEPQTS